MLLDCSIYSPSTYPPTAQARRCKLRLCALPGDTLLLNGATLYPGCMQAVDGAILATLDSSEALKELGVGSVGHRTVLKKLVVSLKEGVAGAPA